MIFLFLVVFLAPILLRLFWTNKNLLAVLSPTVITYAVWYVASVFLITVGANRHLYFWAFFVFVASLLLYEIYSFQKILRVKKIKIQWNRCLYEGGAIVILFLCNIFTYKYLQDTNYYTQIGIEFYNHGAYASSTSYRFNSFYYLATMFGVYKIQFFYTIFIPYLFGIFLILLMLNFVKEMHPKIYKWYTSIFITVLVALIVNSHGAVQSNWITGVVVLLWFINVFFAKKICFFDFLIFDVAILFFLNFSVTSLVSGILLSFFLKCKFLWTENKVYQFASFAPLATLAVSFLLKSQIFILSVFALPLFFFSFFLAGCFYYLTRKTCFAFLVDKIKNFFNYKKMWKWCLEKRFWIFNGSFVALGIPLLVLIILTKHASLQNQNVQEVLNAPIFSQSLTLLAFFVIAITLLTLVCINFCMYLKMNYVLIIFAFITVEFFAYYFAEQITGQVFKDFRIPVFLSSRIIYTLGFFVVFVFPISFLLLIENKWVRAPLFVFSILPFFTAVFPLSPINPVFSASVFHNNEQISKANLTFFLKNESKFQDLDRLYSEIELPAVMQYPTHWIYYDRQIMTNVSQQNKQSIFEFWAWDYYSTSKKESYINWMVKRNNYYLNQGVFFKFLFLHTNSPLLKKPNIKKNYHNVVCDKSIKIGIWMKN